MHTPRAIGGQDDDVFPGRLVAADRRHHRPGSPDLETIIHAQEDIFYLGDGDNRLGDDLIDGRVFGGVETGDDLPVAPDPEIVVNLAELVHRGRLHQSPVVVPICSRRTDREEKRARPPAQNAHQKKGG